MSATKPLRARLTKPLTKFNKMGYRLKTEAFAGKRAVFGIKNVEDIAEKAEVSVQAIRRVLSGAQQNPQLSTLVAICRLLELKLDDVVEWEE